MRQRDLNNLILLEEILSSKVGHQLIWESIKDFRRHIFSLQDNGHKAFKTTIGLKDIIIPIDFVLKYTYITEPKPAKPETLDLFENNRYI